MPPSPSAAHWYNEPPQWNEENGVISVTSAPKTDFWRKTHYGFIRDNGHFYARAVEGNFVAQVKIVGQYNALYDQAGLMIRLDETTWMKCGVELVNGVQQASVVVTRDFSDWSVIPMPQNPPAFWLQVTRINEAFEVRYSLDGQSYQMMRHCYLTEEPSLEVGIMTCTPDGDEGFSTEFSEFSITTQ
jgi:uncharacterized protein